MTVTILDPRTGSRVAVSVPDKGRGEAASAASDHTRA